MNFLQGAASKMPSLSNSMPWNMRPPSARQGPALARFNWHSSRQAASERHLERGRGTTRARNGLAAEAGWSLEMVSG